MISMSLGAIWVHWEKGKDHKQDVTSSDLPSFARCGWQDHLLPIAGQKGPSCTPAPHGCWSQSPSCSSPAPQWKSQSPDAVTQQGIQNHGEAKHVSSHKIIGGHTKTYNSSKQEIFIKKWLYLCHWPRDMNYSLHLENTNMYNLVYGIIPNPGLVFSRNGMYL